uniref:Amidase domain-containing protein n=1 Tax=Globodera rostochiensis TaxID=31243 RepID=A0A914H3Q6_GLORO
MNTPHQPNQRPLRGRIQPFLDPRILQMKPLYPVLKLVSTSYFMSISAIFRMANFFRTRHTIDKPTNELLLISAGEAATLIRKGEISSLQLVDAYIERIRHVNGALNAMVDENFTTARNMAMNIDNYLSILDKNSTEFANLVRAKPLLGVPFTVKDNTFCKGFVCTVGVSARKQNGLASQEDSEAVRRLKEAGAILLGITNVPELALWWETNNTIYGVTNNPYDLRRTPGGSSGGEGALLAAAGSVIGLGNDVGGSLRVPALFCGVFGLKPGPGVVQSTGILPRVHGGYMIQMATAGPMTRYASDLSLMLRVLAGEEIAESRLRLSQRVNFRNVRVFYMEDLKSLVSQGLSPEMRDSVRKTAKYFEKKYDICAHRLDLPLVHRAFEIFLASMNEEEHDNLGKAMSNFAYEVNCFAELVKYPFGWSDHTLPAIITGIRSKLPQQSDARRKFVESKRDQLRREIVSLLGDDGMFIFPAFTTVAPLHNQPLFTPMDIIYTAVWNTLALPALACPLGLNDDGLPTGVQIVAGPDCERLLIAAAQDLEEGFGGWAAPELHWGWHLPKCLRKFTANV